MVSSFKENRRLDIGGPLHPGQVVFFPWAEKQDVHDFLLENLTNGGILELMMRYLKGMGHKFLLRWPPGLAEVVLSVYHSWRRHSTSLPNPLLRDCSNKHIKVRGLSRASIRVGSGDKDRDLLWADMFSPLVASTYVPETYAPKEFKVGSHRDQPGLCPE